MATSPVSLDDIASRFRLTDTIQRALRKEFPFDERPRFVGLARFLLAVAQPGGENASSSRKLARALFGDPDTQRALTFLAKQDQNTHYGTEPMMSGSLAGVFNEAKTLRMRTAGDEYFGLRHVLFETATSADPTLQDVFKTLDKVASRSVIPFDLQIANYCLANAEDYENLHAWIEIIRERRPSFLGHEWPHAAAAHKRAASQNISIAICESDDPWSKTQQDRAGAAREARAFAQMICARHFAPPLAVGVFGNWGSGKSFFMRLLHDEIDAQSKAATTHADGGKHNFHGNIAQIRFNAWHYVETNLWASLVDHIFTCLDQRTERKESPQVAEQLFDQLDTARRLIVESAQELVRSRRERALAFDALTQAQGALAQARSDARLSAANIVTAAWSELVTQDSRHELDDAYQQLGLGKAVASADELRTALADLANAAHERQIAHAARWRWLGRGTTVAIFATLTLAAPLGLEWLAARIGVALAPFTAAVASIAVTTSGALALANGAVRSAADRLRAFGKRLDASIATKTAAQQAVQTDAETKVAQAVAHEAEAERRLHTVSERADAAARDFHAHNSRGQVLRFVRERIAQGDYARQLSFTATVRRDFEELSRLMAADNAPATSEVSDAESARAAHAARVDALLADADGLLDAKEIARLTTTTQPPPAVERIVERIVLYIDDLDRCPPEQVVAVLQAIHLLLAFPLFVVFVAVDVRWLRDALVQQYAWRMNERDGAKTSPVDYLEKIFQIPYWVRPIGADGVRGILKDRFGSALDDGDHAIRDATPRPPHEPDGPPIAGTPPRTHHTGHDEPVPPAPNIATLRLTRGELALIDTIAAMLDGSPRRVLRFVNVYKLIKASLDDEHAAAFAASGHVSATVCLAVNIALPERYGAFVDATSTLSDDSDEPYEELVKRFPELNEARFHALKALLKGGDGSVSQLRRYATLVERYSFQPRAISAAST